MKNRLDEVLTQTMQPALKHQTTDEGDVQHGGIEPQPLSQAGKMHRDSGTKPPTRPSQHLSGTNDNAQSPLEAKHCAGVFFEQSSGRWRAQIVTCAPISCLARGWFDWIFPIFHSRFVTQLRRKGLV